LSKTGFHFHLTLFILSFRLRSISLCLPGLSRLAKSCVTSHRQNYKTAVVLFHSHPEDGEYSVNETL
jgi:hypothetical protein